MVSVIMAGSKGYTPNLRKLISDCEVNYHRLVRLLPDMDANEHWQFGVDGGSEQLKNVSIKVVERSKYTTTIAVIQDSLLEDWVPKPLITVRLYHDAQMAEVLSFQRKRYLQQAYPYPNPNMYHPDEKAQLNSFLGEWLEFCFQSGHALIHV